MQQLPLVTVGVPTYNRLDKLKKTVAFLIHQNYKNIEIIVSDNHSPNEEVECFLETISKQDFRIRYFIQKENIEIEPNFNFVYSQANGEYFMWVADDDEFDINYIEECVSFLEQNKDHVLCSGISKYYSHEQFLFAEEKIVLDSGNPLIRMMTYFVKVFKNGVFYGVYRNNLQFENPIQKHVGADWNHIARTALMGKVHVLDNICIKRSDEGGSSNRSKISARWNAAGLKKIFFETYTAYQIAHHLFNENVLKRKYSQFSRFFLQGLIFILLNFKFLFHSIKRRMR